MTRSRELADLLNGGQTITTDDNSAVLKLKSTDADASAGPGMDLVRDSGSPADDDIIGYIRFRADNDAGDEHNFCFMQAKILDASDGSEDAGFELLANKDGTNRSRLEVLSGETVFNEDSVDVDFRVESNGNANMLFVDGGNDLVGIGTTPASGVKLQVKTATDRHLAAFDNSNGPTLGAVTDAAASTALRLAGSPLVMTGGGGSGAEHLRVHTDGNVGIGVTPANLLHIKGSTNGQKILHLDNSVGSSHGDTSNKIRVTSGSNALWAELKAEAHSFDFQIQGGVTGGILDSDAILKLKSANNIGRIMARSSVTIADDSSVTLTNATAGAVAAMIYETGSGNGALFFFSYSGSPVIVTQPGISSFATSDTDGKFCVIKSAGSHTATFKNRAGSTKGFSIFLIGGDVRP